MLTVEDKIKILPIQGKQPLNLKRRKQKKIRKI
jgi:hypothetical protein